MEAEEMRWRCGSARCNADDNNADNSSISHNDGNNSNNSNNNNSYHKRCLVARHVSTRAGGNSAVDSRHTPKEERRHSPVAGGQETQRPPSSSDPGNVISGSGDGESGPARSLQPKFEMMAEGGGGGLGEEVAGPLNGEDQASELAAVSSVDDDVEVAQAVPAGAGAGAGARADGAGGEATAEKKDEVLGVEYLCPACKGVVVTQEEVETAQRG